MKNWMKTLKSEEALKIELPLLAFAGLGLAAWSIYKIVQTLRKPTFSVQLRHDHHHVEEASKESFPASDAPAF